MSIFNIKLKTKSGNDVKKKETFTVFFKLNYKKGLKTTAEYTYRIMSSSGNSDPRRVLELKDPHKVKSIEDLTLKVMLNFCHIIGGMTQKNDINPDFILFMSPDLGGKNRSWQFLSETFKGVKIHVPEDPLDDPLDPETKTQSLLLTEDRDFDNKWDEINCQRYGIKKEELDLLRSFVKLNPGCHFMSIDPERDPKKYAKSIHICSMLQDRLDRKLEIFEDQFNLIR
jgi:hypothetical protein